jgi:hypothetical protein
MSLLTRRVPINVAADGSDLTTVRLGACILRMIRVELGTLSTPDFAITEQPNNKSLLAVSGVAADKDYYPAVLASSAVGADIAGAGVATPVIGRIQIATSGAGISTTGEITFLYER